MKPRDSRATHAHLLVGRNSKYTDRGLDFVVTIVASLFNVWTSRTTQSTLELYQRCIVFAPLYTAKRLKAVVH